MELSEVYFNFKIKNFENEYIGDVLSVVNYGASDILIFASLENKEFMIPLISTAILKIDNENKEIIINEEYAT